MDNVTERILVMPEYYHIVSIIQKMNVSVSPAGFELEQQL